MSRAQVHPLGLSEYQKGAQSQVADDGHKVEHTDPGASGFNQIATQTHAYHTWMREEETTDAPGKLAPQINVLWGRAGQTIDA